MKKLIAQQLLKAKTGPYMRWKRSTCCPRYNFRSPTCNCYPTAFDVGLNVASQARPGVFSGDQLSSFVDSEVAGQWVIMVPTKFPLWWLLPSHLSGFVLWSSSPPDPLPAASGAAATSYRRWPGRALCGLICLGAGSKIDTTGGGHDSHRWEPSGAARGYPGLPLSDPRGWELLDLPLLVRPANDEESGSSHLWESIPRPGFSGGSETRHQPQH